MKTCGTFPAQLLLIRKFVCIEPMQTNLCLAKLKAPPAAWRQTGFWAYCHLPDCRRGLAVPRWFPSNQPGPFFFGC